MSVTIEKDGAVTTVILDRREVRNAVDAPTAKALADAFWRLKRMMMHRLRSSLALMGRFVRALT